MTQKVFQSKQVDEGEYQDLMEFLMDDLKLFKRKMLLFLKHVETNEPQQYFCNYYEMQHQPELLRLFHENDFEAMLKIPKGEEGRCATQLTGRYVKSGKVVGIQLIEARPHEGGRYVGLTPAKVFVDEEGEKMVGVAKRLHK